ncbi:hypothetical protein [Tardiphaga sp.]|uniref:hypothetical protein n=1 Tax=Tardiphaga sp. TaxID=1926292 RepID=UPI00262BBFD3|nr:hypothetical protein [Tardiphaga sp.]MDB5617861.1 NAD-dependent epimerase/dehydratase [Tardiphaga sp.]
MPGFSNLFIPIIDVVDVASAHILMMTHPAAAGEQFLLSNGRALPMKEIGAILCSRRDLAPSDEAPTIPEGDAIPIPYSEWAANLLILLGVDFPSDSECALILLEVRADFDSPMRRFEPSRPSQAFRAFGQTAPLAEKGPHLAGFRTFGKVSEWRNGLREPPK